MSKFVLDLSGRKVYLGKYKHYKNQYYEVINICTHTETEEEFVYYKSELDGKFWIRPVKMFFENIEINDSQDFPKIKPRFEFIPENQ